MFKYPQTKPVAPKPLVKPQAKAASFEEAPVPADWTTAPETPPADDMAGYTFGSVETAEPAVYGDAPAPVMAPAVTRNVLNSDVSVVGILRFTDDLLVDGSVEGEITSDGVLTVGSNASIQAGEKNKVAVRTKSAIIQGRVTGDVEVTDRVELTSTAELVGNVKASKISIQEGAVFVGYCEVGASTSMPAAPAPKKTVKATKPVAGDNLLG